MENRDWEMVSWVEGGARRIDERREYDNHWIELDQQFGLISDKISGGMRKWRKGLKYIAGAYR